MPKVAPHHAVVRAAGAVCWRRTAAGGLEVLLVRSARWDEWSWPKGKVRRGESLPEAAVREVGEETGVQIALGPPLPAATYQLPDGATKIVHHWAARAVGAGSRTASDAEIAQTAWVSPQTALDFLPRDSARAPLHRVLELDDEGRLGSECLLVVRHAKARGRSHWDGDETTRPLTRVGRRQAQALVPLLGCWRPALLLTSPWTRCHETVEPYALATGLTPRPVPELTERGRQEHPGEARRRVDALLDDPGPEGATTAVCTHRPVLDVVVAALAARGSRRVATQLPDGDPWLAPAEMLVVHSHDGRPFWVEKHQISGR